MEYIYDANCNIINRSRNMRGIREYVGKNRVRDVSIRELPDREGFLRIDFLDGSYYETKFVCFETLKWAIRNWRNLRGAQLIVNEKPGGVVSYTNPFLQETMR